jgi:putative ABC transport system permease protein
MKIGIVDNNSLYFMEVYNEDEPMSMPYNLKEDLEMQKGVAGAFFDSSHPVKLIDNENNSLDITNIFGVSIDVLKFFGIDKDNVENNFIFLNKSYKNNKKFKDIKMGDRIYIKDYKYVKDGELWKSEEYLIERTFYGFVDTKNLSMFNSDLSLIDYDTSKKIARGMTKNGDPYFTRLIVIAPEVDMLEEISDYIKEKNSVVKTRYTLETTGNLPRFAVIIVTISIFIIVILFLISTFSVSSNLTQIFNLRKRDIALFDILGIEESKVMKMFIGEIFIYGIVTFLLTSIITFVLFYGFKSFLGFDILTNYQHIYYLLNFVLSVGILVINSFIKLKKILNTKNTMEYYKEVLK